VTSGSVIKVGAIYKNDKVLNIGGQFGAGEDWSDLGLGSVFDGKGAVLLASVPDGFGSTAFSSLTINGSLAFTWDEADAFFPNNHAPLHDDVSDFLFSTLATLRVTQGRFRTLTKRTTSAIQPTTARF